MTSRAGTKSITLSIRSDLADRLEEESETRVVGKALLVEKALEKFLPTLPPIADPAETTSAVED